MNILTDRRCLWLAILLAAMAALVAVVMLSAGYHPLLAWLPPFFIATGVWLFVASAIEGGKRRRPNIHQMELAPDSEGCAISAKQFNRLRWIFDEDETEVRIVVRRHWIVLVKPVLLIAAAYISLLTLILWTRSSMQAFLWIVMLSVIPVGVYMTYRSWKWLYDFLIVTNVHVRLGFVPWKWILPFGFTESVVKIPISRIDSAAEEIKGLVGNIFNYGTLKLDTPSTGDVDFNDIRKIPNPSDVSKAINARLGNNDDTGHEESGKNHGSSVDQHDRKHGPATQPIPAVRSDRDQS